MQTFFISMELWEIVQEGFKEVRTEGSTEEEEKKFNENMKKNAQALRYIKQGVSKFIFSKIFGVSKAKDAWEILKLDFQGNEKNSRPETTNHIEHV